MWEQVKNAFQWIKKNLIFCGSVLLSILLAALTYYKRKASSLESQIETIEKRKEVEKAHEETEKAEKDYEAQKKSYEDTLSDYKRKYGNGSGGEGGSNQ
jgi:hypothetical protein